MSLKIQEVGSLPKPLYLLWANRKEPLSRYKDKMFSCIPGLKPDEVKDLAYSILGSAEARPRQNKLGINPNATYLALVIACMRNLMKMDSLKFDYLYTGEMHRIEMYEFVAREFTRVKISEKAGIVRSFEDKFYTKFGIISQPDRKLFSEVKNPYLKEFQLTKEICQRIKIDTDKLKVPMTGPYTMVNWSYIWHDYSDYEKAVADYVACFASVIGKWAKELVDLGCTCIQIDEPAATTLPTQMPAFVNGLEVINRAFKDLKIKPKLIVHICYSDWKVLVPFIEGIKKVGFSQVMLELSSALKHMKDAQVSRLFDAIKKSDIEIGLGIVDVHTDVMEDANYSAELVRSATNLIGEEKVWLNPDCGLRTRKLDIAYQKLELLDNIRKAYRRAVKELKSLRVEALTNSKTPKLSNSLTLKLRMEFYTKSSDETIALGGKIGAVLKPGDVLGFYGDLGSGKTTMIKGIALGLGVKEQDMVKSPSFVMISEYKGRHRIYHVDLYRTVSSEEFIGIGLDDYLYGDGVCLIEWAEKAQGFLPENLIKVELEVVNSEERKITVSGLKTKEL